MSFTLSDKIIKSPLVGRMCSPLAVTLAPALTNLVYYICPDYILRFPSYFNLDFRIVIYIHSI